VKKAEQEEEEQGREKGVTFLEAPTAQFLIQGDFNLSSPHPFSDSRVHLLTSFSYSSSFLSSSNTDS
jgi:hypothetical protein